jgi:hypothetical protein
MKKNTFLNNKDVLDFIKWIEPFLDNNFVHSYELKNDNNRNWKCNSIYNAFEEYCWPNNGQNTSFDYNQKKLNSYKFKLKNALDNKNQKEAKDACIKILKWGELEKKNEIYINNNKNIINELTYIKKKYGPNIYDTNTHSLLKIVITSGFSKIYSILFDDFIIYDSRVSAALCYLIKKFCSDKNLNNIPSELKFSFSKGRKGDERNPNNDKYIFTKINQSNYLINNIKASWLLSGISENTKSKFNELSKDIQLRALEAAFFMIGYEIK